MSGGRAPCILNRGCNWKWRGSFAVLFCYLRGKSRLYLLKKRLRASKVQAGRETKRKVSPVPTIDLRRPAHSLVAVLSATAWCIFSFPVYARMDIVQKFEIGLFWNYVVCTITQGCEIPRCPVARPRFFFKVALIFVALQYGMFFMLSMWCTKF